MSLNISVEHQGDQVILHIHEKSLNQEKAPTLKEIIYKEMAEGFVNMIVDLSEVRDVDSSGLGAFLFGKRLANNNGGELVLACPGKFVQNLLRIAQLTSILKQFPTIEEAQAFFTSSEPNAETDVQ